MASIIDMPKLSDTMTAGVLLSWLKKEGDSVEPGEAIAEVESDKANMEMEAYEGGVLKKIIAQPGESIDVGAPIAILAEDADEDISDLLKEVANGGGAKKAAAEPDTTSAAVSSSTPATSSPALPAVDNAKGPVASAVASPALSTPSAAPAALSGGRVTASPVARNMAADFGLDINQIAGSGPNGRVVKRDVLEAKEKGVAKPQAAASAPASGGSKSPAPLAAQIGGGALTGAAKPATQGAFTDHPLSSMRAVIAKRLLESKTTIPHFQVSMDIDMAQAEGLRGQLKDLGHKISINDLVIKATALAITKFPMINASFQGDKIRAYDQIDIGVAVSIDDGLVVPVLRQANLKGLGAIAAEIRDLATRARAKQIAPAEMSGGTFTISNLGMYGVSTFNAIINPPESAILAVGGVQDKPVVKGGEVVAGRVMTVTISADHRVVDGAMAAEFLRELKTILENPLSLAV